MGDSKNLENGSCADSKNADSQYEGAHLNDSKSSTGNLDRPVALP